MVRAKNILTVCLGLTSAVLAFVVWQQRLEIRRLTTIVPSKEPGLAIPIAVRPATRVQIKPSDRSGANVSDVTRFDAQGESSLANGVAPVLARNPAQRRSGPLARLMENPEFLQALAVQRQAAVDLRFAELFRRLNLAGDELAMFKHLLAEKDSVALDVVTVSETSPEGPLSPEGLRASVEAAQAQVEQAILHSLGSERYAIYREYESTLAQRTIVAQLEQRLSYTNTPLTPTQSEALVRVLAAHTPAPAEDVPLSVVVHPATGTAVPVLPASPVVTRVTEEAVVQAQSILDDGQVAALRQLQAEQQAAVRTAELVREALPGIERVPVAPVPLLW